MIADNIRSGVSIFGVSGNLESSKQPIIEYFNTSNDIIISGTSITYTTEHQIDGLLSFTLLYRNAYGNTISVVYPSSWGCPYGHVRSDSVAGSVAGTLQFPDSNKITITLDDTWDVFSYSVGINGIVGLIVYIPV